MAQARGDVFAQILFGVTVLGFAIGRWRPDAVGWRGLGGDKNWLLFSGRRALAQHLADEAFAPAVAVAGGGIDEVARRDRVPVCSAASESVSACAPHEPPMAQAPKPISEQLKPCLPKERNFMGKGGS